MADQIVTTTTTGFGKRILNSIIGIPLGLIMIVVGIGLLYWNEGSFDLAKLAGQAIEFSSTAEAPANSQDKLVAVTGSVTSTEQLGDTFLKPGSYLALNRNVEVYAWTEKSESKSQDRLGGSGETTTTTTYTKQWVSEAPQHESFKVKEGHANIPKAVPNASLKVGLAKIGGYGVDIANLELPEAAELPVNSDSAITADGFVLAGDGSLYKGANYAEPSIGDMRIKYFTVTNPYPGVVLGKITSGSISTFTDSENHSLLRLFSGNKDSAIKQLHSEYITKLWLFRALGFFLIFIGLTMLLGPITALAHFLPTLGHITGAVIGTIAFPVALLLTGVTILVSKIAHNPIALGVSLAVTLGAIIWFIRKRGAKVAQPA